MKKVFNFILVAIIFMNSILYFSYSDSTDNQYWRSFIYDKQAWGLGAVNRLASHGDKLFVSGYFGYRFYDTVCFNGIAELSNNAWLPMGTGEYAGVRGSWLTTINDMIIKDSMLYVVGSFDTAGAISAKNIAKWNINTRTWSSVGKGTNGIITSIVRLNNKLFIGGRFDSLYTSNDTILGHNIAVWDGTNWDNLDNVINVSAKTYQYALYDYTTEQFVRYEPEEYNEIEMYISVFGRKSPSAVKYIQTGSNIDIYPNPTSNNTKIKFKCNDIIPPTINICNSIGIIIDSYQINKQNDNNYDFILNTDNYPVGVYLIQIISTDKVQSKKIMVIK